MEGTNMGKHLKLYFFTLVIFFAVDMVWLSLVAQKFYSQQLGFLMTAKPVWLAAIIFYLLFIVGVLVLVVVPGLESGSLRSTLLRAALFGLISYATYDLTNLATLKNWPLIVTVVDLAWGTAVSTIVSWAGFVIGRRLGYLKK
jgi:uncharacterized membrane protein